MTTIYTVNNKVLKNSVSDKWLIKKETPIDPYNPLGLPSNTIRVRTSDGSVPSGNYETATLVQGTTDVYDVYKSGTDFSNLFSSFNRSNAIEVLGANTTGITNMERMFFGCSALISIPLFDTSSVTRMRSMFENCSVLTAIPLFDTSSVTTMERMFYSCTNVESGALALYQQASTQTTPPSNHMRTFYNCGSNTTTGAAELAQIPSNWK